MAVFPTAMRGRDFPAQQIERQIPRRNQSGDAARLAQRVVEGDAIRDVRFVFGVQNRGREKAKIGRWRAEYRACARAKVGLPVSIDSARANFSRSRSIRSAMRKKNPRTFRRPVCATSRRNAFSAAATASSTSRQSLSALANRACPSPARCCRDTCPPTGATKSPSMKFGIWNG